MPHQPWARPGPGPQTVRRAGGRATHSRLTTIRQPRESRQRLIEPIPHERILHVDHALRMNPIRLIERPRLHHDDLARKGARSVEPTTAVTAEMTRHLAPGVPLGSVRLGRTLRHDQLVAVNPDDRRMTRSSRLLTILAAALTHEQRRPPKRIADGPAQTSAKKHSIYFLHGSASSAPKGLHCCMVKRPCPTCQPRLRSNRQVSGTDRVGRARMPQCVTSQIVRLSWRE